jgi:D-alanyl-D-alanine dipeptidase
MTVLSPVAWLLPAILCGTATAPPTAELVDVTASDARLVLDMKYATADNFTGRQHYDVGRCLLRPAVAAQVHRAQDYLDHHHLGMRLVLKDCYRPVSIQRALYAAVAGTFRAGYVANPAGPTGSVHTYGAAVDVSLVNASGREVDMGTPFDYLGRLAQPRHEAEYLRAKKLTPRQVARRHMLRRAMVAAGFRTIPNEWWHFDAVQGEALRRRYTRLDVPLAAAAQAASH